MFKMGHTVEMAEVLRDWLGSAEPLASRADVERVVALFDKFPEGPERGAVKGLFKDAFGLPHTLTATTLAEAESWLAERLAQVQVEVPPEAPVNGDSAGEVFERRVEDLADKATRT
jgi:hypothetical protein